MSMLPENQGLLCSEIQRLTTIFKAQRCALDFDRGFVNSSLKEAKPQKDEDDVVAWCWFLMLDIDALW
jgi:hypothetical protein